MRLDVDLRPLKAFAYNGIHLFAFHSPLRFNNGLRLFSIDIICTDVNKKTIQSNLTCRISKINIL